MENKIDIVAILKDCPRGMELDCPIYDNVTLDSVVFESEYHYENTNPYPIKIVTKSGFSTRLTKYRQNVDIEEAKCVIFPKGKKTWEGFQRPFVDGDIITDDHGNIAIYKGTMWYNKKLADYYCGYRKSDDKFLIKEYGDRHFGMIEELHYATKEEKRKLFDVIKENYYEWDVENKTLRNLIKPTFKDGDIISDVYFNSICIFKGEGSIRGTVDFYCGISRISNGNKLIIKDVKNHGEHFGEINKYNFATEEEKQNLFRVINDNGYQWNAETKTLEKNKYIFTDGSYVSIGSQDNWKLVPNKFDINTLKTFDQVLVRLTNNCVWTPKLFSHYATGPNVKYYPFVTIENIGYPQCIPYNGNEHLSRTTNNCDEFYRNWEE